MNRNKTTEYLMSITVALAIFAVVLPLKLRANESYEREKYIGPYIPENSQELSAPAKKVPVEIKTNKTNTNVTKYVYSYEEDLDWVNPEEFRIDVTDEEIDLMARVVMSEASMLNPAGKQAVATTIVNRVLSDYKSFSNIKSVSDAITPGQFSINYNGYPDDKCYDAVYMALMYEGFPTDMLFFWKSDVPPSGCHNYMKCGDNMWNMNFFTINDYSAQ